MLRAGRGVRQGSDQTYGNGARRARKGRVDLKDRLFILAPDSFKGTISAEEICSVWSEAIRRLVPEAEIATVPMADGGEGMTDAYLRVCGGERVETRATGPLGAPVNAFYGLLPNGAAILEMAACAGLPLVGTHKDPMTATTRGVGEVLQELTARGVSRVLLGLGGSATNDGGIGMAAALGYAFLDENGEALEPLARNLGRIRRILPPATLPRLEIVAACDVDNPLCGENGASHTFGAQKGADAAMQAELDAGLRNLARVMRADLGKDVRDVPGAGAAGGLGAGVLAFLGGTLSPGVELMLDEAGFDAMLPRAGVVFTGEGRIDWQSARGKVPVGVARRARRAGVPCIALCGSLGPGVEAVYNEGVTAVFTSVNRAATIEEIGETCREDLRLLMDAALRLLLSGCGRDAVQAAATVIE